MYFEEAIERVNRINWQKLNILNDADEQNLGYEYLRRLAIFFQEQSIKPINPLVANIGALLGDKTSVEIADYCTKHTLEGLKDRSSPRAIIKFYLQLAKYIDKNPDKERYLAIYNPLIELLEKGFEFGFREGGLMIYNAKLYPLNGWYERFVKAEPIDIGDK